MGRTTIFDNFWFFIFANDLHASIFLDDDDDDDDDGDDDAFFTLSHLLSSSWVVPVPAAVSHQHLVWGKTKSPHDGDTNMRGAAVEEQDMHLWYSMCVLQMGKEDDWEVQVGPIVIAE